MRQCPRCAKEGIGQKPDTDFAADRRRPDGRRSECRTHARIYARRYYVKNKPVVNAKTMAYKKKIRDQIKALLPPPDPNSYYEKYGRKSYRKRVAGIKVAALVSSAMLNWRRVT